jgi:hypothetical protein
MSIRLPVTPSELAKALLVWLRIMPRRVWRELESYEAAARDKRHDPERRPDVQAAIAEHIAGQIERANWEVTRPEPHSLGSPPPWQGRGD